MVTYDTNSMGVANLNWYKERGLTKEVEKVVGSGFIARILNLNIGDTYTAVEVTQDYCCGRIDIRDSSQEGYWGWQEYSLAPMLSEDWMALTKFLNDFETDTVIEYDDLIELFEDWHGAKIRWWKDEER